MGDQDVPAPDVPAGFDTVKGARLLAKMDAWLPWLDDWRPGWVLVAGVLGLFAGLGPRMAVSGFDGRFRIEGFVGLGLVAGVLGLLAKTGIQRKQWGLPGSLLRGAAVLAVGSVLWLLPDAWSIPTSVIAAPYQWLLQTIPFILAALVTAAEVRRVARILAGAVLVGTAVLWPTFCGLAAAEVRHRSGIPADAWYVVHIDGYKATSYSYLPGDETQIGYVAADSAVVEETDDLDLTSWPAGTAGPCDHFGGAAVCTAVASGTWSVVDHDGMRLVTRQGTRYLALEEWSDAVIPIPPDRLPAILASAHLADDHEVLALANAS